MKDKNLPPDYDIRTLEELTDEANQIIKLLEEEDDLDNSVESYQELLKINNLIGGYGLDIGIILLWLSAILTIYTGYDYIKKGIDHALD